MFNQTLNIVSTVVISAGIIQGFFLTFLLARKKNGHHFFLASVILFFSLNIALSEASVRFFGATPIQYMFLLGPFQLLIGPLLFFFMRSVIREDSNPSARDLVHFFPVSFHLVILVIIHVAPRSPLGLHVLTEMSRIAIFMWALILLQMGLYLHMIDRQIHKYKEDLKSRRSSLRGLELAWIGLLLKIFVALNALNVVILIWYFGAFHLEGIQKILATAYTGLIYYLGYRGFFQTYSPENESRELRPKYASSSLDPQRIGWYWDKLETHMEREKPYLNPELKLGDLADALGISPHHLSQTLSSRGKNFYEYVNGFRIEEIKRLLKDPSRMGNSILELAFEGGFNSKTTFNTLFKKSTGSTPTRFRRK